LVVAALVNVNKPVNVAVFEFIELGWARQPRRGRGAQVCDHEKMSTSTVTCTFTSAATITCHDHAHVFVYVHDHVQFL